MVNRRGMLAWTLGLTLVSGCTDNRENPEQSNNQAPADVRPSTRKSGPAPGMSQLRGRLVDNLADPIAGAEVLLQPATPRAQLSAPGAARPPLRTHTDLHGRFALEHPPAAGLLLAVDHPYRQPHLLRRDLRLRADHTLDLGDLVWHSVPGLVVVVRARESQQPVSGAEVQLSPALADATLPALALAMQRRQARTSESGRAVLYDVGAGAYILRVTAKGHATVEILHQQPASVERALQIPVQLPRGLVLRGLVVSQGKPGNPVADARIVCVPHGGRLSHAAKTDARGQFSIPGMRPQGYRLMVTHPGHAPLVQDPVEAGLPLTLRLPRGHAVEGRVLDRVNRRPVPGARVVVRPAAGWPTLHGGQLEQPGAVADASGHFRVGGLPAGIVFLRAESQGSFSQDHGPVQPDSGPVTLLRRAGCRVTGKVQDPAGQPVRDAMVEVIPSQKPGTANRGLLAGVAAPGRGPGLRSSLPRGTTGSSGRFDLGGLPPGEFRLRVRKKGLPAFLSQAFVTTPRGNKNLGTLRLAAGGCIQGVATGRSGGPAVGVTVCLDPSSGLPPESLGTKAVSDDLGRFALGPVAPGSYDMFYYSPGKETAAEAAASRDNTVVRVRILDRQLLTRNLHPRSR